LFLSGFVSGGLDGSARGAGELEEFIAAVFHVRCFQYPRIDISGIIHLIAAAGGTGFLDRLFDRFTGFARALLNPANQFLLLAFGVLKIVIGELGPLLLQLAFGDVPVAFDF
jgi:hypothetical protein